MSKLWELSEAISRSYVPAFAEGVNFDDIMALNGMVRKGAIASVVESGRGRGIFGTTIPAGTVISVVGNSDARFVSQLDTLISVAAINEIQKLVFSTAPASGGFKVIFEGETTAVVAWNAGAAGLQAALESLSNIGVGNVVVSGTFDASGVLITFQGTLGASNRTQVSITENTLNGGISITPSTLTQGDKAKTALMTLVAEDTGPIAAPTNSLTVIETPVVGLQEFTNEQDATLGRDIETDPEAKERRENELQLAGAATTEAIRADMLELEGVTAAVVFSNRKSIVDIDGRPPHSVDIVVEGGDEDEIAEAIFNTVADGIDIIGAITKTVIDSQGFAQTIKFSRPTEIDVWIEVDVTIDPALFPSDGEDLIEEKILQYGASLSMGDDVVVFGSAPALSCSFDDVPGMTDLVFRVGTSASPTLDNNIPIAPREKANFDSARILVTVL